MRKNIVSLYPGPHLHVMHSSNAHAFLKAIPCRSFLKPSSAPPSWGSTWPGLDARPVEALLLSFHPLLTNQIHVVAMKQSFCTATMPDYISLPEANTSTVWKTISFSHKIYRKYKKLTLKYCVPFSLTMQLCSSFSSEFISHDPLALLKTKCKQTRQYILTPETITKLG